MDVKKIEKIVDRFYNDIVRGDVQIGQKAQDSYDSILDGSSTNVRVKTKGIFVEKNKYISYDSTSGEIFVEETDSILGAINYLYNESDKIYKKKDIELNKFLRTIFVDYCSTIISEEIGYYAEKDIENIFTEKLFDLHLENNDIVYRTKNDNYYADYKKWINKKLVDEEYLIVKCKDCDLYFKKDIDYILRKIDSLEDAKFLVSIREDGFTYMDIVNVTLKDDMLSNCGYCLDSSDEEFDEDDILDFNGKFKRISEEEENVLRKTIEKFPVVSGNIKFITR